MKYLLLLCCLLLLASCKKYSIGDCYTLSSPENPQGKMTIFYEVYDLGNGTVKYQEKRVIELSDELRSAALGLRMAGNPAGDIPQSITKPVAEVSEEKFSQLTKEMKKGACPK